MQDTDIFLLFENQHGQRTDHIKCRHDHDQAKDAVNGPALHVHNGIQAPVLFIFVLHQVAFPENGPYGLFDFTCFRRIIQGYFDPAVIIRTEFQRLFYKINIGNTIFIIEVLLDQEGGGRTDGIITDIFQKVDLFGTVLAG